MDQLTSTHSETDEKANGINAMEKLRDKDKERKRRGVSTARSNVSKTATPLILVCLY